MVRRSFFVFFLLLSSLITEAQNDFCSITNTSFQGGEKLTFKVFYNMGKVYVGAGEASFTVKDEKFNNRTALHVTGDGKTYKSYDWIFRVRDRYETYIDANTMLPLRFVRNVDEGGYKINNDVTFNHTTGKAKSTNGEFKVPKCIQDVLSAIYFARNIDYSKYKAGDKIPFAMFLDDQIYNLYIRYVGKETVKTKYGEFNAIKISPLLIDGTIFNGGEKMMIWVSDDKNHIPLRVNSPILVGNIKVDLVGYEGLRNPFSALIKLK